MDKSTNKKQNLIKGNTKCHLVDETNDEKAKNANRSKRLKTTDGCNGRKGEINLHNTYKISNNTKISKRKLGDNNNATIFGDLQLVKPRSRLRSMKSQN